MSVNFFAPDPLSTDTCMHCQHSYHDVEKGKACPFYGVLTNVQYISPNDCESRLSLWLNDYRRRPDLERKLNKSLIDNT